MPKHNPEAEKLIDNYIAKAQPFAREICGKLRRIIMSSDKSIVEDWKWGPNYSKNGMICGFGAFKNWVTLTFFQGSLMNDYKKVFNYGDSNAHNRSIKFKNVSEIEEKVITEYVLEAIRINESGKALKMNTAKDKMISIPADLKMSLKKNNLIEKFDSLSYTQKKEYVIWINDAKKEETREKRVEKTINVIRN